MSTNRNIVVRLSADSSAFLGAMVGAAGPRDERGGLQRLLSSDSVKRVARTFVIAFLGIFLPGALGFLHGLTEWASSQGQTPFPDMHSLAYAVVAAIVAGCIALVNLIVVWLEDATGKGLLRDVDPTPPQQEISPAEVQALEGVELGEGEH